MPERQEELRLQALEWQVILWSCEVTQAEQNQFDDWLKASPEHQSVWQSLQPLQERLQAVPDAQAAAQALRKVASQKQRRIILRSLLALLTVGVSAHAIRQTPQWQTAAADQRTGTGEIKTLTLPDGSQVTLNTATALDIEFSAAERLLILRSGEVLIRTAADPLAGPGQQSRPFLVQTRQGTVQAIGTEFTVRQLDDETGVAVLLGAVEIRPIEAGSTPVRIQAGQKTHFSREQVALVQTFKETESAWTKGYLAVEQMRLGEFASELARYRPGAIRVDPAIANLRVSGTYQLADTDRILQALERSLPVRVRYISPYWVRVVPR